ncbi:methylenetetrahydrofolate reductase [Fructobacillus ficulneus]|uniref:Methylenetetrahydrofolate reductase n=1 Tax=Fructobacillus ficulneus TaxID=157463 RepID=A0A0K8MGL6_9LACO|nr:methylenetetrahydrofolate reductase [Fructobacillus ficulneus]GAO99343.1 methylenetetrahydrofolate reductase [Fructobacillus ficulneus]
MTLIHNFYKDYQPIVSQERIKSEALFQQGEPAGRRVSYQSLVNHSQDQEGFKTLVEYADEMQKQSQQPVLFHLRAGDVTPTNLVQTMTMFREHGLENLLIISGDQMRLADGYSSAISLLEAVQVAEITGFDLAATLDVNQVKTQGLKAVVQQALAKEGAGAKVLITQVFFHIEDFLLVQDALREAQSKVSLVAGIMENPNPKQLAWVKNVLHGEVPEEWLQDPVQETNRLVAALTAHQAAGIHYFAQPKN